MAADNNLNEIIRKNMSVAKNNQHNNVKPNVNLKPPLTTNYSDQNLHKARIGSPISLNESGLFLNNEVKENNSNN